MQRRIPKRLTARAREMRSNPTEAERALWPLLSRFRPKFTRQCSVPPFVIDLACRQARLGVEFDGSHHLEQLEYDEHRTAFLRGQGWTIIRLRNTEVLTNPEGAATYVLEKAAECLGGTHPQPLPCREGRKRVRRFD